MYVKFYVSLLLKKKNRKMYLNVYIVKRYLFNTFRLRKQPGVKSTKDSCVVFENPVVKQSMEETSPQG